LRIGRGGICQRFADDLGAVVGLPGWTGEMFAERLVVFVKKLGVGSFEGPGTVGFAGIDLIALGVNLEQEFLIGGRLELRWKLLLRNGDKSESRGGNQFQHEPDYRGNWG